VHISMVTSHPWSYEVWSVYRVPFGLFERMGYSYNSRATDAQGVLYAEPHV